MLQWDNLNKYREGNRIVIIEIPRTDRRDKPIYIGTNPLTGSYRRNGEGDYHCTPGDKTISISMSKANTRKKIIDYLSVNNICKASDISRLLDLKPSRTRYYLSEMVEEKILISEGANRNRIYRLKV